MDGDANRRSIWIRSRNDVIGNVALLSAAVGVFGTGTGSPDVIQRGWQIVRQARGEWEDVRRPVSLPAE